MKKIYPALLIALLAFFLRFYLAYTGPTEYDEPIYTENVVQLNLALRQGNWSQILDSTTNYESPQFYKLVYAAGLLTSRPMPNFIPFSSGQELAVLLTGQSSFPCG